MAKRGRKPTPTRLKLLRGNPGRRPVNKDEPQPEPISGDSPPKWLSKEARTWWKYYGPRLERAGLLTTLDEEKFGLVCRLKARVEVLERDVAERGFYFTTQSGYEQIRPAASRLDAATDRLAKLWSEFGGSPSSRTGIEVRPPMTKGPRSIIEEILGESDE